jgi:hypothetical protein
VIALLRQSQHPEQHIMGTFLLANTQLVLVLVLVLVLQSRSQHLRQRNR